LNHLEFNTYLNDAIINFMIERRLAKNPHAHAHAHVFNTFFWPMLCNSPQQAARWTKDIDIFDKTVLLIPVHDR
jgi:Ulp1 family protease